MIWKSDLYTESRSAILIKFAASPDRALINGTEQRQHEQILRRSQVRKGEERT